MNNSIAWLIDLIFKVMLVLVYLVYALVAYTACCLIACLVLLLSGQWLWAGVAIGAAFAPWMVLIGYGLWLEVKDRIAYQMHRQHNRSA